MACQEPSTSLVILCVCLGLGPCRDTSHSPSPFPLSCSSHRPMRPLCPLLVRAPVDGQEHVGGFGRGFKMLQQNSSGWAGEENCNPNNPLPGAHPASTLLLILPPTPLLSGPLWRGINSADFDASLCRHPPAASTVADHIRPVRPAHPACRRRPERRLRKVERPRETKLKTDGRRDLRTQASWGG